MLLTFILTFVVRAVKSAGIFPRDIFKQVIKYSHVQTLDSLSQLNHEWNQDYELEEEMSRRRVAERLERARLVNELDSFRLKSPPSFSHDLVLMNASEEIEHYLNGFDCRMYEWMMAFHTKVNGAVQQQIEKFATKLAEHRATYPRPPPHRHGNQEDMPLFDAFIRMRDKNMKILQNRMQKDNIMFDHYLASDPPSQERRAMIQMMRIIETIGIEIDYPGVQKMQKKSTISGFWWYNRPQVQKLLAGTVNIRQLEYD